MRLLLALLCVAPMLAAALGPADAQAVAPVLSDSFSARAASFSVAPWSIAPGGTSTIAATFYGVDAAARQEAIVYDLGALPNGNSLYQVTDYVARVQYQWFNVSQTCTVTPLKANDTFFGPWAWVAQSKYVIRVLSSNECYLENAFDDFEYVAAKYMHMALQVFRRHERVGPARERVGSADRRFHAHRRHASAGGGRRAVARSPHRAVEQGAAHQRHRHWRLQRRRSARVDL
jgi:hypothetical protein